MPVAIGQVAGIYTQDTVVPYGQPATLKLVVEGADGPFQMTFQRNADRPETKVGIPSTTFSWGEEITQTMTFTLLDVKNGSGKKITIDPEHRSVVVKLSGTGIEEDISSQLAICPNPARDIISISIDNIDDEDEILIYNMMGQYIKAVPSSGATDISDLKPGIYILKIPGRGAYKLVKQ